MLYADFSYGCTILLPAAQNMVLYIYQILSLKKYIKCPFHFHFLPRFLFSCTFRFWMVLPGSTVFLSHHFFLKRLPVVSYCPSKLLCLICCLAKVPTTPIKNLFLEPHKLFFYLHNTHQHMGEKFGGLPVYCSKVFNSFPA